MGNRICSLALVSLFVSGVSVLPSYAKDPPPGNTGKTHRVSIVEENDMYIDVHEKSANLSEADFNAVLDRVQEIYAPIIKDRGGELSISRNWDDGTVNAYAQQTGSTWEIAMFGGLARHPAITTDAFALVACHELGHHAGGLPKKRGWFWDTWASAEGQSDYYGAAKCLRKYLKKDNNVEIVKGMKIDPIASSKCSEAFAGGTEEDVAICERSAMAGYSLGKLFEDLKQLTTPIEFSTPDTTVAEETNTQGYPEIQCRLDTYFAGALCNKSSDILPTDDDANASFCSQAAGDKLGFRPTCWYKP